MRPARSPVLRYLPVLLLAAAGALAGYLYYRFVGCASGACLITSNPWRSSLYGAVIGSLLGVIVTPDKKAQPEAEDNKEEFHE